MERKKNVESLDEIAVKAKLEFIDDGLDEPRSGTPDSESPETLPPKTLKSYIYHFKQNFGLSLMGITMISYNLNKLLKALNHPVYYNGTYVTLLATSVIVEACIVISALVMATFNMHIGKGKAVRFNNGLLFCVILLAILHCGLMAFDFMPELK